jgi:hypothetical protein
MLIKKGELKVDISINLIDILKDPTLMEIEKSTVEVESVDVMKKNLIDFYFMPFYYLPNLSAEFFHFIIQVYNYTELKWEIIRINIKEMISLSIAENFYQLTSELQN